MASTIASGVSDLCRKFVLADGIGFSVTAYVRALGARRGIYRLRIWIRRNDKFKVIEPLVSGSRFELKINRRAGNSSRTRPKGEENDEARYDKRGSQKDN